MLCRLAEQTLVLGGPDKPLKHLWCSRLLWCGPGQGGWITDKAAVE